jgi:AraC-like DNA-binding protein
MPVQQSRVNNSRATTQRTVAKVHHWLRLAREANYRPALLARLLNKTQRQIQRELQQDLGRSPEEWLNEQRMVAARHLVLTGMQMKQIAALLGYNDPALFSRQFKAEYGVSPREYRLRHGP